MSVALVSATVRHLQETEYDKLDALVQTEDSPEVVVAQLDCQPLYDVHIGGLLNAAIVEHRLASLKVLLEIVAFGDSEERDQHLGAHLSVALKHSEFEAANALLGKIGLVRNYDLLWPPPARPWDLDGLKAFVGQHPDRLAELVPRYPNVGILQSPEDVIALIDLAEHCHVLSVKADGPSLFDPTYFLYELLRSSTEMADAGKAAVTRRLLEAGAEPAELNWGQCLAGRPDMAQTYAVLQAAKAKARLELQAAILAGDNAAVLSDRLEGYTLPYDQHTRALLDLAIQHRRHACLDVLLAHVFFGDQAAKDAALGFDLSTALQRSDFEVAAVHLGQMASVPNWATLWQPPQGNAPPWNLADLTAFVERHRARVQDLVPRYQNLVLVRSPRDALVLIALARHCDANLRQHPDQKLFDPTWFLYQLLRRETAMADADKAVVAHHLLAVGADRHYALGVCARRPAGLAQTCAAIGVAQARAADEKAAPASAEALRPAAGAPITTKER